MTHKDIYTKYMIEYDKANVTSSYPALTEYEAATILDKAYKALIALKLTGSNLRRVAFEGDVKAIADLQPLVTHKELTLSNLYHLPNINITSFRLPVDHMYFIQALLEQNTKGLPADGINKRLVPTKLVDHRTAEKFFATPYNMPWVKIPVCFIESDICNIVYDPINTPDTDPGDTVHITYLRKPVAFTRSITKGNKYFLEVDVYNPEDLDFERKDHNEILNRNELYANSTNTDGVLSSEVYGDPNTTIVSISEDNLEFELSDTMAEELISLAISFSLENVESPRLNTKLNMRGLES